LAVDDHGRDNLARRYVYSVLSRRAGGISLGINLNPDRICNWACAYCQVSRTDIAKRAQTVDEAACCAEISELLGSVADGSFLDEAAHRSLPDHLRRVVDLSFSGDGEPTTAPAFGTIVDHVIAERQRLNLDLELVVLSNNSLVHRPEVAAALQRFAAAGGVVHVKLDAGDEAGYLRVDRSAISWARCRENMVLTARLAPIVVQSLFCAIDRVFIDAAEAGAYAGLLSDLLDAGGSIVEVHLHTVARPPPFADVHGLPLRYLEAIAALVVGREPRLAGKLRCVAGSDRFVLPGAPAGL
jgi:wyosine [tRNA(Phe)-imidazoG37] synthetase (radical SAM superfamily)